VIVTAGVRDADTEWHFTQERRIGASHAHSAKIIADEKHKFVSSGGELVALQQRLVRPSAFVSTVFSRCRLLSASIDQKSIRTPAAGRPMAVSSTVVRRPMAFPRFHFE
jgi:hypothetical protein